MAVVVCLAGSEDLTYFLVSPGMEISITGTLEATNDSNFSRFLILGTIKNNTLISACAIDHHKKYMEDHTFILTGII